MNLPSFTGNPLKRAPEGTHLRVWTQHGAFEYVGRFTGLTFSTEDGKLSLVGVGYCRIENAETGEVYYDNGWYR